MIGKRRKDTYRGMLPDNIEAGDYWKVLDRSSREPAKSETTSNLIGSIWMVAAPMSYGFALGNLTHHTVREHDDDTISIRPNDGSSNSILITGHNSESWHGYIEHGEWKEI